MFAFRSDWAVWARGRLPPALLILALASLFAFGGDMGYFKRSAVHSENSAKNLAIAMNLSPSEGFRLFKARRLNLDGSPYYVLYGRFPIGGTALIKLAISPFETLSAKMAAARTLAALMFCGAVIFAYLAVARLAGSRWIALAAVLIAFSSYYALYYSDEVSNESAMDIFGIMLAFHGMAVFVQDGRFRQLALKACAALLIGWHVYALILSFIVFGLAREVVKHMRRRSDSSDDSGARKSVISLTAALVLSRHAALGAITALFGIALLGANLAGELRAYEGGDSRERAPSWQSALRRTVEAPPPDWDLRLFASRQLFRAGGAALPYALPWKRGYPEPVSPPALWVVFGGLAVCGALAGAALARRHRALWAALALFGFFWAIPVRNNTFSEWRDFEAVFYVGVPLALFAPALIRMRERWGVRPVAAAAIGAAAVFAISAFQMGRLDEDAQIAETQRAEMADYDVIREKTRGEVVAVSPEITGGELVNSDILEYYLAGSVLAESERGPTYPQIGRADFVISRHRDYNGFTPLTPENRRVFLYAAPPDPSDWHRAERRRVESGGEPAARSGFDLYLRGGSLHYIKDPCAEEDRAGRFFLSVHPIRVDDLPAERREIGHDNLNTEFAERGTPVFDGACMMKRPLPDYPIRLIETGQWQPGEDEIWRAAIIPPLSKRSVRYYNAIYESARASGEPLIRSDFDVHMQDGALIYTREPCAEDDALGRFFLSVHPANVADLPAHRRALGHDGLNFDFSPDGVVFGDRCMIRRELPTYEIDKIVTGQDAPGGGRRWSGEAAIGE